MEDTIKSTEDAAPETKAIEQTDLEAMSGGNWIAAAAGVAAGIAVGATVTGLSGGTLTGEGVVAGCEVAGAVTGFVEAALKD